MNSRRFLNFAAPGLTVAALIVAYFSFVSMGQVQEVANPPVADSPSPALLVEPGSEELAEAAQWDSAEEARLAQAGVGASAAGATMPETAPNAPAIPGADPSLNENYRSPEMDVDFWVKRFELEARDIYHAREEIIEAMELREGLDVADVGAGTGFFTLMFAEAVGPEGDVFAVEISPRFMEHIRDRAEKAGLENIEIVEAADDSSNLYTNSVDVVFISDTYHHFEQPLETMQSLYEAMRPGGRLYVIDFKRIPGESAEWIFEHVRAGQETFIEEIEAAGFDYVGEVDVPLEENYMITFTKQPEDAVFPEENPLKDEEGATPEEAVGSPVGAND